jgi:hypothetical protein
MIKATIVTHWPLFLAVLIVVCTVYFVWINPRIVEKQVEGFVMPPDMPSDVCPRGFRSFKNAFGQQFCCAGDVNPLSLVCSSDKVCAANAGTLNPKTGQLMQLCSDYLKAEWKDGEANCPPSLPNYAQSLKCCANVARSDGSECMTTDISGGQFCELDDSMLLPGQRSCANMKIRETIQCPPGLRMVAQELNAEDVKKYGKRAKNRELVRCVNLNNMCYPDDGVEALRQIGIFKDDESRALLDTNLCSVWKPKAAPVVARPVAESPSAAGTGGDPRTPVFIFPVGVAGPNGQYYAKSVIPNAAFMQIFKGQFKKFFGRGAYRMASADEVATYVPAFKTFDASTWYFLVGDYPGEGVNMGGQFPLLEVSAEKNALYILSWARAAVPLIPSVPNRSANPPKPTSYIFPVGVKVKGMTYYVKGQVPNNAFMNLLGSEFKKSLRRARMATPVEIMVYYPTFAKLNDVNWYFIVGDYPGDAQATGDVFPELETGKKAGYDLSLQLLAAPVGTMLAI